ncbi:hypothetical protein NLG97_g5763 [Lecanicillium saksenae]|uniref:Uncharacterized protein n=1 Tax=Lecanicillium saksenae TaxID=468837 RepID=A0ACC1QRI2_9HYPO|nr:hypothetical protein NLG97_g5763 [Lecanicillium saksenae]
MLTPSKPRFSTAPLQASQSPVLSGICDDNSVFAWVHSSDPAWGMYQKSGFEVIRSLDIDLDEYAPCKPPGEGEDAKWGHYVFRYMKYFPKTQ